MTRPTIEFRVEGKPVPQPRGNIIVGQGRKFGTLVVPRTHPVHAYKRTIRWAATESMRRAGVTMLRGPVEVQIAFVMPRPKSMLRKVGPNPAVWAPRRPDIDNLEKAVFDAMNGVVWVDDGQIVRTQHCKMIPDGPSRGWTRVIVRALGDYV